MLDTYSRLKSEMKSCQVCLQAGYSIQPGAIFSGSPHAGVMIVGQAPGITETAAGRPFNATSGTRLFDWLGQAGWEENQFRESQYMTSVTKCYPGKHPSGHGDRVPSKEEQKLCNLFLKSELNLIRPNLLIPVGRLAISHFLPGFRTLREVVGRCCFIEWKEINGSLPIRSSENEISLTVDKRVSSEGFWTVPLPHPSGASLWPNQDQNGALIERAIRLIQDVRSTYNL